VAIGCVSDCNWAIASKFDWPGASMIRFVALSMISGRSEKLDGGSGNDQPAIRRTTSALPTTIKYLAMGTADSSREFILQGFNNDVRNQLAHCIPTLP
jgi:hypothetical protein